MRKLPEMVVGMLDKHQTVEELCNGKLLSTVLKTNGIVANPVEFNTVLIVHPPISVRRGIVVVNRTTFVSNATCVLPRFANANLSNHIQSEVIQMKLRNNV
jgi:hypothetical protein